MWYNFNFRFHLTQDDKSYANFLELDKTYR